MTNRREFLQIGASASAWPLLSRAAHAAGLDEPAPSIRLAAVVYDTRFAASVAFASRAAALGLTTRPIEADMTRLWYEEIYHRWRQEPVAIAGLTAYGPMFCFGELARDVRMRIVFRAEHRTAGSGLAHRVTAPVAMLDGAVAGCRTVGFGAALADVVVRCPQGRHEMASMSARPAEAASHEDARSDEDAGGHREPVSHDDVAEPDEDALYTWVIAPATPA